MVGRRSTPSSYCVHAPSAAPLGGTTGTAQRTLGQYRPQVRAAFGRALLAYAGPVRPAIRYNLHCQTWLLAPGKRSSPSANNPGHDRIAHRMDVSQTGGRL